jgi:hypothetical protein
MYRKLAIFAAAIAAFAFTCQSADAKWRKHHVDSRITAVAIGVGAASTVGYFAINNRIPRAGAWGLTTIGCAAVSPIVATVVLNRPLTLREAHVLFGSCVIPLVGGWLVNEAFNAHPEWDPDQKSHHAWNKKHHRRAKM